MNIDALAAFLTDPRVFLAPLGLLALLLLVAITKGGISNEAQWQFIHTQSFLVPLCAGLVFGPGALANVIGKGTSVGLDWAAVINFIWLLTWLLAFAWAVKQLRGDAGFRWLKLALGGYNLGWIIHVGLWKGEPLIEAFGGA